MDIDLYYKDEEYKLDYYKRHYFNFLNIIVKVMKEHGESTDNHTLHEFHKMSFDETISLKEITDFNRLEQFLKQVDSYWNQKLNLTFL